MRGCYRRSAKKKKGRRRALWSILEFGGSDREKKRKEGKKEKNKGTCVEEKKRGKKKGKKKEMQYVCGGEKKRGKKKEILSQYFHNKF